MNVGDRVIHVDRIPDSPGTIVRIQPEDGIQDGAGLDRCLVRFDAGGEPLWLLASRLEAYEPSARHEGPGVYVVGIRAWFEVRARDPEHARECAIRRVLLPGDVVVSSRGVEPTPRDRHEFASIERLGHFQDGQDPED